MGVDPYMEWWSLEFDPAAENRQHDHLSTLSYMPVMIQVRLLEARLQFLCFT